MKKIRNNLAAGNFQAAGCGNCTWRGRRDIETYPRRNDEGQSAQILQNIKAQHNEYKSGVENLNCMPTYLNIQVSLRCNFHCSMCFQQDKAKELPDFLLSSALSLQNIADEIQFTGGEPFISSRVVGFLKKFDISLGQKLSFTTNGSLIHDYFSELKALPRLHLGISVDAARQDTYKKIRRGGDYSRMRKNVEWVAEQKKANGKGWRSTRLAYVIMADNYEEIPLFVRWARELSMPVMFAPVWGGFAAGQNIFTTPELRAGLTPPGEIWRLACQEMSGMGEYEKTETYKSLRYSLNCLGDAAPGHEQEE